MQHPIRNGIIVLIGTAAIFTLGLMVALRTQPQVPAPATSQQVAPVTVDFLLDTGDKITSYPKLELYEGATVLTALEVVAAREKLTLDVDRSSSMGAFIKQIGDKKNGQAGKYWQYWVGGVQPLVAADKLQLKGGETVLWTFRKSAM